jgi:hypothetical protein
VVPDDHREEWEERAAIMQYEAGMTRERAERMAAERILRREGLWQPEQRGLFDKRGSISQTGK